MMSVLLKNGHILSNEELFAIPADGGGWRILPDGNTARIGDWARIGKSPLAVQGTLHLVSQYSAGKIAIGCEVHTHEEWLRDYKEIGEKNGYSAEEIEEYGRILRFVIENAVPIGVAESAEEETR